MLNISKFRSRSTGKTSKTLKPGSKAKIAKKAKFHAADHPFKTFRQKRSPEAVRSYAEKCHQSRLSHPTIAELAFAVILENLGVSYEREKIITYANGSRFILADFFLFHRNEGEKGTICELDGSAHKGQMGYDKGRDAYFRNLGYAVWRMQNSEVLETPQEVMAKVRALVG